MFNKKFLAVMAVLFAGASLFFAGCDNGGGTTTVVEVKSGEVYGGPAAGELNAYISEAVGGGSTVTLRNVALSTSGIVDLMTAKIVGTFTTSDDGNTVINARNATFDPGTGATIVAQASDTVIVKADDTGSVTANGATLVTEYVTTVSGTIGKDTALGGNLILNSATVDALTNFASTYTVYVVGTTAINTATAFGTGDAANLVFLGATTASGANEVTLGANTSIGGTLTATGPFTLAGVSKVVGTLNTGSHKVSSGDVSIALNRLNSSPGGKLSLTGAVTDVNIGGGNGSVEFVTGSPAFTSESVFGNTGTTTFTEDTDTAANLAFAGTVIFEGELTDSKTSPGAAIAFNGLTADIASYAANATANATTFAGSAALTIDELTDTVNGPSTVTFNGTSGTAINSYAAKVTANATTFAGSSALTIGTLTDTASGESTVVFNGTSGTTINAYTANAAANVTIFDGSSALTIAALTDTAAAETKVTFNGAGAKTVTAYTAKATANATTFDGASALTITTLTDASEASAVIFDGTGGTTVTSAVTTLAGGLTIGGTGAVALAAAPILTNGLVVTNTEGVTIPSVAAALPASQEIDASTGTVIFGTSTNSVTIEKGTLSSGENGLATVAAGGVITLPFNTDGASLTLEDDGTLTIAGSGSVTVAGALEITGDTTTLASTNASTITAASASTATLTTGNTAEGDGIQIGTVADGVALLAVGANAMTYTFTASVGTGTLPVTVSGVDITVPADSTTGAIFEATTPDKAKILLGTTSGGFKIGQGGKGGKFSIVAESGGSKIGAFGAESHEDGYLPVSVGLTGTEGEAAADILLGAYSNSFSVPAATVTLYGASDTGYATIDGSVALVEDDES
jgi:hypothetical protein